MDRTLLYVLLGIGGAAVPMIARVVKDREERSAHKAATAALADLDLDQAASLYAKKLVEHQQAQKLRQAEFKILAAIKKSTQSE